MLSKIINFIMLHRYAFLALALLLVFVFLFSIIDKKKKITWIGFILFILSLAGFIFDYFKKPKPKLLGYDLIIFVAAFTTITLIVTFIEFVLVYFSFRKNLKLISSIPSNIDNKICALLDDKSRIFMLTDKFYDMFENQYSLKQIKANITYLMCDGKSLSIKEFLSYIGTIDERNYNIRISMNNGKNINLELTKRKVTKDGILLGFILTNQKGIINAGSFIEFKRRLTLYLDLLNEAIAYYDSNRKKYNITKPMATLLGVTENEIDEVIFEKYVLSEDLKNIKSRNITENESQTFYRIQTSDGFEWFEERTIVFESNSIIVLHRTDFTSMKYRYKSYNSLVSDLQKIDNDYFLVFLSINDFPKIADRIGQNATEVIVCKYLTKLKEIYPNIEFYKVGYFDYGMIIEKRETYDLILRDLNIIGCDLTSASITFNEVRYELRNSVGLVESNNVVESTPENVIKAGLDALSYATDENYNKNYSIYYPTKTNESPMNDLDIDLSDDFLNKILK